MNYQESSQKNERRCHYSAVSYTYLFIILLKFIQFKPWVNATKLLIHKFDCIYELKKKITLYLLLVVINTVLMNLMEYNYYSNNNLKIKKILLLNMIVFYNWQKKKTINIFIKIIYLVNSSFFCKHYYGYNLFVSKCILWYLD